MINGHKKGNVAKITQDIKTRTSICPCLQSIILTQHSCPSRRPTFSLHHCPRASHSSTPLFCSLRTPEFSIYSLFPFLSLFPEQMSWLCTASFLTLQLLPPALYFWVQILSLTSGSTHYPGSISSLDPTEGIKQNPDLQTTNPHFILHVKFRFTVSSVNALIYLFKKIVKMAGFQLGQGNRGLTWQKILFPYMWSLN